MNNFNTEKEIRKDIEGFESEIRKRIKEDRQCLEQLQV